MPTRNTLLLGTRKGLLILERDGAEWSPSRLEFPGAHIQYACSDPRSGTWWACVNYEHWGQHLHRSSDAGKTWQEVPVPGFPEGSLFVTAGTTDPMGVAHDTDIPAKVQKLWTVIPGSWDTPGRIYVGTAPGGLFRSDDKGDSFTLVEALWNHPSRMGLWFAGGAGETGPVLHSIVLDPRSPDHIYVGISCAGVFETEDGGSTWQPRNNGSIAEFLPDPHAEVGHDAHCLVQCRSHPDVLWQQNHCGIFRTINGGREWEAVSQKGGVAHFGFPIAVDDEDPNTAWVVPAISDEVRMAVDGSLYVARTTDGGATWEALRRGLPQRNAYDIVFRHALDVSGDQLAFGSTTGNAYISADRGETWECLGNNLPPIYSVRFA